MRLKDRADAELLRRQFRHASIESMNRQRDEWDKAFVAELRESRRK